MTTIYKHDGIMKTEVKHGLGIVATENIAKNTILNVDVLIVGDLYKCMEQLATDEQLYTELCPRERIVESANKKGKLFEKVLSNSFGNGELILGHHLSFYNHSCNSNAVYGLLHLTGEADSLTLGIVFSLRDIPANEEICLFYGERFGHDENLMAGSFHKFSCKCSLTNMKIRGEKAKRLLEKGRILALENQQKILKLLYESII
ncbi:hypothetical protein DFS34DRAFT_671736 [Phlyctochytrium arcticum]|nr:hypothetical protein DFS34DRAFT_661621 [Phlyctochytrium arcticum]KAI9103355.1 hypothetical protein DFS34DRAFT_671736 [Phlyctochytrium arcticum]